jgi:hypothetical protein
MPNKGDFFIVKLGETHVSWGTQRYTDSRPLINFERYIPIPASEARRLKIYNSNYTSNKVDELGINCFYAESFDGNFKGQIKATGCAKAGDVYAKNLSGKGNLKAFSEWFEKMKVGVGTQIRIEWLSSTEVLFTIIS